MGNKPSSPPPPPPPPPHIDKCSICHVGMRALLHTAATMPCASAAGTIELGCQAVAVSTFESGVGEVLEPVCGIIPYAFTAGCKEAASNPETPWAHYVLKNACSHLC